MPNMIYDADDPNGYELSERVRELEEDKAALDRVNAHLTEENEKLRNQVWYAENLEKDRDFWLRRAQEHAETIDELRANGHDVAHWRNRADRFETLAEENQRKLRDMAELRLAETVEKNMAKREVTKLKAQLASIGEVTTTAQDANRRFQQQLDAKEDEIREAHADKEALDREVTRLQRALVESQVRVKKLQDEKQGLAREIDRLRNTIYPQQQESIPRALVQKWRDSLRHESADAARLHEYATVAANAPVISVLNEILKGEEPRTS